MTTNTARQDHIIDQTGADSWLDVVRYFFNKSLGQITADLDRMFYLDDNEELANMIYEEVN